MVRKEMQFGGLEKLTDLDAYHDIIVARAESTEMDKTLCEYKKLVEENNKVDVDYKNLLLYFLTKEERVEPHKKRRERDVCECDNNHDNDCYPEEENDPQYELFLESLMEYEKSYAIVDERNGFPVVIKYEEDGSSDKEYGPEPRRTLRSAMKQKSGPSNEMPGVESQRKHHPQSTSVKENKSLARRKSRNMANNKNAENAKCFTTGMVPDSDYLTFRKAAKVVDDHYVYIYGGHTVVYEKINEENNQEKEEHDDECPGDVEILDYTSFYKAGNPNLSMMNKDNILKLGDPSMQSEFRQQIITVLRKPYNDEEYLKLWLDIENCKPEYGHIDLRNGRERARSRNKDGKSYLDYHPDLRIRISECQDDKPKCLNLLRGFFFWLQNVIQHGSFPPWQDAECLAIVPESC